MHNGSSSDHSHNFATVQYPPCDSHSRNMTVHYRLRAAEETCRSDKDLIGMGTTAAECAALCEMTRGCRFFAHGIASGQEAGHCMHEKTNDASCPEGWVSAPFRFGVLLDGANSSASVSESHSLEGSYGSYEGSHGSYEGSRHGVPVGGSGGGSYRRRLAAAGSGGVTAGTTTVCEPVCTGTGVASPDQPGTWPMTKCK